MAIFVWGKSFILIVFVCIGVFILDRAFHFVAVFMYSLFDNLSFSHTSPFFPPKGPRKRMDHLRCQ